MTIFLIKSLLVILIYILTLVLSGKLVRFFLKPITGGATADTEEKVKAGQLIGKCENLIGVTCVMANQLTGLALIFAGKSLVRNSNEERKDDVYLCGTLVNLVWSVLMGYLARFVWNY